MSLSMNREVLRIALPNIISNITVPMMGIISTAIAGRCSDDSAISIGQLAIGVSIFNMIYWNCSFVRMGTSGFTAQAFGAGDFRETTRLLYRTLILSLLIGVVLLALKEPLAIGAVKMMGGSDISLEYVRARMWAVPAGILLFGFHGWFTGMQNGTLSMFTALTVNILHIAFSLYLALNQGLGVVGIAYASVIAQWVGVTMAAILLVLNFRDKLEFVTIREVFNWSQIKVFFSANVDIMIRVFCIVAVYTYFTRASAHMGDDTILAVNTLLLQLFTLYSYMTDGFAYAAEALTGRFIGACDLMSLKRAIKRCIFWSVLISIVFIFVYILYWHQFLHLLVGFDGSSDAIISMAGRYIGWIIVIPLAGAFPFLMDGIMVGAGFTKTMRNSMFISSLIFFVTYFSFHSIMGNNALWLAFFLFMALRGAMVYLLTDRLAKIYAVCK